MAFFVYIAIVLVALSGILLEIDWLTSPKLETRAPLQTASTTVPPPARAPAKAEGPNDDLSPVYPKKPEVPRSVDSSVTGAPQPGAAVANAPAAGSLTPAEAKAEPPQKPLAETTGSATPAQPAEPSAPVSANAGSNNSTMPAAAPAAPAASAVAVAPATPAVAAASAASAAPAPAINAAAANRCDVQACASAYQSFRAADCTYQPFAGTRRLCEKPPRTEQKVASRQREARGEASARRPNKDAELREVVRSVRELPVPSDDDDDIDSGAGARRIIVIERPARGSW